MAATRDISFIIINYNDADRLPRALSSAALVSIRSGFDYEIWVVDNGSTDHSSAVLSEFAGVLDDRLRVIHLERNTGTTYSRNLALERANGRLICIMDSDAELLFNGLKRLDHFMSAFSQVGIAAPRIIMPDGSTYNSVKKLPTLSDKLAKLPGIFSLGRTINLDWYPDFPFLGIRPVDTAISCCWFFRRDLFQLIGPLDENIFYAPEDVDWCLRCWEAGRAVVYYPYLQVLHHTRQISHHKPFSTMSLSHLKGIFYYLKKHHYWFRRSKPQGHYIRPLADELTPALSQWEYPD